MQNMMPANRYGKPVRVFFDTDHATGVIHNVSARDAASGKEIPMSEGEREQLIDILTEEVTVTVFEALKYKQAGKMLHG